MTEHRYDIAIIGAGTIGLATAVKLLARFPSLRLAVLEREDVSSHTPWHVYYIVFETFSLIEEETYGNECTYPGGRCLHRS
jgi:cation diffusion facilitator CzcD-associated flavoprotein CzcO